MTEAEIKLKRTESILCELIPEAFGSMNDARLHELEVLDVKCSRGKSDARVYIHPNEYTQEEKATYIKMLQKVRPLVENYCLKDQGWYRCPKLTFEFDTQLERSKTIDQLFEKISQEKSEK